MFIPMFMVVLEILYGIQQVSMRCQDCAWHAKMNKVMIQRTMTI